MSIPSPLTHSWPLFEESRHFDLGCLLDDDDDAQARPDLHAELLAAHGVGLWECDLADDALTWTAGVFDIFNLPHDAVLDRTGIVALYVESSRAAMERLRAHAIRHRRGFTIDAEIVPAIGPRKWMRLIAAPVCVGRRVVRLRGIKQDVSALYD